MNKFTKILVLTVTCLAVGYLSGIVTRGAIEEWFRFIEKPSFNPPNWVFQPVWTFLYIAMGVAAGLVWDKIDQKPGEVKSALAFFAVQLALNAGWSLIFFGLRNPLLALIEIVLLWLMIYETYIKFSRIRALAGYLFIPYLLWVSFAAVLNASIWWLNR